MTFSSADWTIDYVNKDVTNNDSGTGTNLPSALGNYSKVGPILEFFQWLAAEFANSSQMDDTYPIQSDTPTVFKWLNGWTFGHADDYKYLNGGSIEDPSGSGSTYADSLWSNLYSIGSQEVGTQLYMITDDAEITPWWISGNIDILVLVKDTSTWVSSPNTGGTSTDGGVWIYAREFGETYDHNFTDLSAGGRNPIGINTGPDSGNKSGELYVTISGSSGTWTVGSFLSDDSTGGTGKITKVVGNDIYVNAVRGGTITAANGCSEYTDRELQTAGDASATISSVTDVVAGWSTITFSYTDVQRDLNNGAGTKWYDTEIDGASTYSPAQVYEYVKYVVRYNAGTTVDGDAGEEYRSAAETSGGGATSEGPYGDVKVAPFGTLAGTTFYGARGIWVKNATTSDFVLIASENSEQAPPNYQKVNVFHTSLSGCNIFVAERSGSAIVKDQYAISTATSVGDTSIVIKTNVNTAIELSKTPQSGVIRIGDTRYWYASFSDATDTLTLDSQTSLTMDASTNDTTIVDAAGDFINNGIEVGMPVRNITETTVGYVESIDSATQLTVSTMAGNTVGDSYEINTVTQIHAVDADCYIPLMDRTADATSELSDNLIYSAGIDVITSVRKYGKKPYDVETAFGSTGLSFSPILTVDPQAT